MVASGCKNAESSTTIAKPLAGQLSLSPSQRLTVDVGGESPMAVAPTKETGPSTTTRTEPFNAELLKTVIRNWHDATEPAPPLEDIQVFPVEGDPSLCVAICDYQPSWWGYFGVYGHDGRRILWKAQTTHRLNEQSVKWIRGLRLPGFPLPVIEVFGCTHMGNGHIYLYELSNQSIRLVLDQKAIGRLGFWFGAIKGDRLVPTYRDLDGDGVADLLLNGEVVEYADTRDTAIATSPCQLAFLWNPVTRSFERECCSGRECEP